MVPVHTIIGDFNKVDYDKLKSIYKLAVRDKKEKLRFKEEWYRTDFIKYVLEYLELTFGKMK